jgi:hypothetical protein
MKTTSTKTNAFAKARAAKAAKAAATGHQGPPLTEDQILQRERTFGIYREFGKSRTIHELHRVLSEEHPDLLASKVTLDRWSKRHNWVGRAAAFDRGIAMGLLPPPIPVKMEVDPNFNSIDALLSVAQMALTKAMNANPVVTRPGDVKSLVDAAANAMKLIETLEQKQAGKGAANEIAADIARICDMVEAARRKDVDVICRAAAQAAADLSGQPIEPIYEAAARAAGMWVKLAGQLDKPAMVAEPATAAMAALAPAAAADEAPDELVVAPERDEFQDLLARFNGELGSS